MKAIKRCPRCGVPEGVGRAHNWQSNGIITQVKDPDHRMVLSEAGSLDRLFGRVEERIGFNIQRIVIDAKALSTRHYWECMLPAWKRKLALKLGFEKLVEMLYQQGRVMGYGNILFDSVHTTRGKPDQVVILLEDPYSLPLFVGDFKGVCETIARIRADVEYERLDDGRYRLTASDSGEPFEELERLETRFYPLKPGNIELERCGRCRAPWALSETLEWNDAAGTIMDKTSGRRMALFGPGGVNAVFRELEQELGEGVPQMIVEAERDNTLERALRSEAVMGPERFRQVTALRGLGSLAAFDVEGLRLSVRIENPAFPLLAAGLAWGLYEIAMKTEGSDCHWKVREDGDLQVDVEKRA